MKKRRESETKNNEVTYVYRQGVKVACGRRGGSGAATNKCSPANE